MITRQSFTALAVFSWLSLFATASLAEAPLQEVRRLAASGQTERALGALEAVLAEEPNRVEAVFLHGVLLFESGQPESARRVFEGLVDTHPDLPEAYNNLAVIQAAAGDYDEATENLKRSLGTDPSYKASYENLTRIFAQLASEAYGRALDIESPERQHVDLVFLDALSSVAPPAPAAAASATPAPAAEPPVVASQAETRGGDGAGENAGTVSAQDMVEVVSAPEAASPEPSPEADEVTATVADWAQAWSEQRVEDYLGFYSEGYSPGDEMSHDDWEALRRDRLSAPEYIRVDVAILDSAVVGDLARVTFRQDYESDRFSDQVTKSLELERHGGSWKIVRETTEP